MARNKPEVELRSWGIYTQWESASKDLPKVVEFTKEIPATVDVEFGLIARIKKAKNQLVDYCIYHPGIVGDNGKVRPPFDGQVYAKSNDWDFFLGDTVWEPIEDKLGPWRLTIEISGKTYIDETFTLVQAAESAENTPPHA